MLKKSLLIFATLTCMLAILHAAVPGGISGLQGNAFENAVEKLKVALNKIKALDGPAYTIAKVNKATKQVVSGINTHYAARLRNENGGIKNCNASIWEQPWLPKGTQVTISCTGDEKYTIKYDP